MMRRILSCVLVLVMMSINFCSAAELRLPLNTKVIDEEAFRGAASIDTVVAPDGITNIESRAFADSSVREMNLPGSLTYIADDAFEGCGDNLMLLPDYGSYAHQWCRDHDMLYHTDGMGGSVPESAHAVHSVDYDGQAEEACFVAEISTTDECVLVVEVQDDAGSSLIDRLEETVQADLSGAEIWMVYEKTMPVNYRLEAWLQDASGTALCEPFINIHHTQAYEEFMNQTAADYPADRVLDYGNSGYIVLADNVKKLGVKATTNADGSYTFKTSADLKAGDVIVVSVDGVQTPMKIGSITEDAAGTVTVVESDDVALEELFSVVNISTSCGGRGGKSEGVTIPINIPSTSVGEGDYKVKVESIGSVTVDVDFIFRSGLFNLSTPYLKIGASTRTQANTEIAFRQAIDTFKDNNAPKISIFDSPIKFKKIPFKFPLTLAFVLNIKAEEGLSFTANMDVTSGISYDTVNGVKSYTYGEEPDFGIAPLGKVEFYLGPEAALNFDIKDCVTARIGIHGGSYYRLVNTSGLWTDDSGLGSDAYHACQYCLNGDTGIYAWPRITVKAKPLENLSITPMDEGEPKYSEFGKIYCSVINDVDSIFEGLVHPGVLDCPNWKYKTDFYTENVDGEEETGVPIAITGGNMKAPEYGSSPYSTHLYPGEYKATAVFSSNEGKTSFNVLNVPQLVFIEEEGATINGVVLHNVTGEPISGAHISLTGENGKTYETTTDSEGKFLIEKVREGTYDYYVTKQGFRDLEVKKLEYTAGTTASVKLHMVPLGVPLLKTGYIDADSARVQALTEEGECPEGIPKIFVTVDEKAGVGYKKVTIEHEHCEEPYTFTNTNALGVDFHAVDMGNGEYTMLVSFFPSGTGSGKYNYILHEINGVLKLVKTLKYNEYPDNIRVSATFTSGSEYSGTILPTGHAFSGIMLDSNDYRKDTSLRSYDLGYVDLELREDGFYNLIFRTKEYGLGYFDPVGSSYTRFVLKDGNLTIDSQWYESDYSTVTNK